jgi:hypothetical protein
MIKEITDFTEFLPFRLLFCVSREIVVVMEEEAVWTSMKITLEVVINMAKRKGLSHFVT